MSPLSNNAECPKQISLPLPREGLLKNHNIEFSLILLAIRHPAHHPQWCAFYFKKKYCNPVHLLRCNVKLFHKTNSFNKC
jgi:hypothetical protein